MSMSMGYCLGLSKTNRSKEASQYSITYIFHRLLMVVDAIVLVPRTLQNPTATIEYLVIREVWLPFISARMDQVHRTNVLGDKETMKVDTKSGCHEEHNTSMQDPARGTQRTVTHSENTISHQHEETLLTRTCGQRNRDTSKGE